MKKLIYLLLTICSLLLLPAQVFAAARISVATDDFNRASLGANWQQLNQSLGGGVTTFTSTIFGGTGGSDIAVARWVGAGSFTADQYSVATVGDFASQATSPNYGMGVVCRAGAGIDTARNYYFHYFTANGISHFGKVVNGTITYFLEAAVPWAIGNTIEIECEGSAIRAMRNGAAIGGFSAIDTSLTTGNPGIMAKGDAGAAPGDNFIGGTLAVDVTPPSIPGSVTATPFSTTQNNLTWTASTDDVGVVNYRLENCAGAGCVNFAEFGVTAGTSLSDTALQPSTLYRYRIRAFDAAGNPSGYSTIAEATTLSPDSQAPTVPTNVLTTVVSANQINLTWTASTDNIAVINYRVENCAGAGCVNFAEIGAPTATNYSDTLLTAGTVYRYRIRAFDGSNFSAYSTIVQATTLANRQATVTWADTVNTDHTGYTLQRKTGVAGTYADLITVGPAIRQYIDVNSPQPIACYRLFPIRSAEQGPNSSEVCTTTSAPTAPINLVIGGRIAFGGANTIRIESRDNIAPSIPANLLANVVSSSAIDLTWTASTDNVAVINYRVERCAISDCLNFVEIAAPTVASLSDTGLTPGTAYQYRVRAWDGTNFSGYSNVADSSVVLVAAIWVRPTGTMAGCTTSMTPPATNAGYKATITSALTCIGSAGTEAGAGQLVLVGDGVYNEALINNIPSGSAGGGYFTLRSVNQRGAIIRPTSALAASTSPVTIDTVSHYIAIDGFVIDAGAQSLISVSGISFSHFSAADLHHIRIINGEIKNTPADCIGTGVGNAIEIANNLIHNCSVFETSGHSHGIYLRASDTSITSNTIYNVEEGYGIHAYDGVGGTTLTDNVFSENILHNIGHNSGQAAILASGTRLKIFNNLAYSNQNGIWATQGGSNVEIYNNTLASNTGYGLQNTTVSSMTVRNNISRTNGTSSFAFLGSEVVSNNTTSTSCTGCTVADPQFVNAAGDDYRLLLGSPAIGAGADLSTTFTTDITGATRGPGAFDTGAYAFSTVSQQLVASYSMNAGTGSTALDSSGKSNNGTFGAGVTWTASGKYGNALAFDGTQGKITIPNSASLNITSPTGITLMGWFNPSVAQTDFRAGIVKDYVYYLYLSSTNYCGAGGILGGTEPSTDNNVCYATPLAVNTWTHLAFTYDGATEKLYVNGVLVSSQATTGLLVSSAGLLTIGASPFDEFFAGKIDEVRIYNSARTAAQIITDRDTPL